MTTQNTRCGGGDGEHTGPVLIGSTVIVLELTSTALTMDLTLIVLTSSLTLTILAISLTMASTTSTSAGIGAGPGSTTSTSTAIGPGWLILSTAVCTRAVSTMTTALSCGDSTMKITTTIGGSTDLIEKQGVDGTGGLLSVPRGRQTGGSMTTGGASTTPDWSWTDPENCKTDAYM